MTAPTVATSTGILADRATKVSARDVSVFYGEKQALYDVSIEIPDRAVTAFIGPSGCGKTTFLRCINRMNDLITGCKVKGVINIEGADAYGRNVDPVVLRARVGMVFQKPNPFPKSIYENVAYGPRIHGSAKSKADLDVIVEQSLRRAGLWDEVKERLHQTGTGLSGGQQQRLVIARAVAVNPDIILMDEPCSALDVGGTSAIEELMFELQGRYTIVIVTHNMAQARRTSDECIFMLMGEVVEHTRTEDLFLTPKDPRTADYIEGRYG